MSDSTSIRVSRSTRNELRALADHDGITQDEALALLLRAERQRRIGAALAEEPSTDDNDWIEASIGTINDHVGKSHAGR